MDLGGFINATYVDVNGVYRWRDTHRVPSEEILRVFVNDQDIRNKCAMIRQREASGFQAFRSLYRG